MCEFEGWTSLLEPACLLWKPDDYDYERPSYMTRTEKDKPQYTAEQEAAIMSEQVNKSDGFDIDFSYFRCVFNYHPAVLNERQFVDDKEPEITDEDLLNTLSKGALDDRNQKYKTEYEFVEVVRANFHFAGALVYLITFQVKDPCDGIIKNFRARVRYAEDNVLEYIFCEPEPNQKVECVGIAKTDDGDKRVKQDVDNDARKQRLE